MENIQFFSKKNQLPPNTKIVDTIAGSIEELLVVRNPELKSKSPEILKKEAKIFLKTNPDIKTVFAYYPWRNIAVHIVNEDMYLELRTARNKNIINKKEQELYRKTKVGIVGLSIGSNVLNALTFGGGPKKLKIADYDVIEITNLNRLRAPILAIGENKTIFAAQQVWELDPFANLELWTKGVSQKTIEKFITNPKLDIFIDEMDSLDLKFMSRIICKNNKIPVVMVTDNGDNIILDVERFDQEPSRDIFHGFVNDINLRELDNITYNQWVKIATKIVGPENLTDRMKESVAQIGKTIAAVPQLGTTATIAGATAAYVVRKIANNQLMPSGRYFINLDEIIR